MFLASLSELYFQIMLDSAVVHSRETYYSMDTVNKFDVTVAFVFLSFCTKI